MAGGSGKSRRPSSAGRSQREPHLRGHVWCPGPRRVGPKVTLATGALIIALGFLARIGLDTHLWEIIVGTSIAGAGIGIAYAAMP
jgi:hypothetical protein